MELPLALLGSYAEVTRAVRKIYAEVKKGQDIASAFQAHIGTSEGPAERRCGQYRARKRTLLRRLRCNRQAMPLRIHGLLV
jgi:hypothetical protein